jgi:hypothetical protein
MKTLLFALALLIAGLVNAQPWQWQQLQGDFYNPTGFPERGADGQYLRPLVAIGDFNGDGRAEYYDVSSSAFRIAVRDEDRFHWTTIDYPGQGIGGVTGLWAVDLDHDGQDELVVYADSVSVLKAVSFAPWEWELRNDLLNGLYLPAHARKAIFGDYDGDGLLNAVVIPELYSDSVEILHRNVDGEWIPDSTAGFPGGPSYVLDIFDGDFNHDGRLDFGVSYATGEIGAKDALTFFENSGNGIVRQNFCDFCSTFTAGGDLDGDGRWEELERDYYNGEGYTPRRLGYYLRHTAADSSGFVHFTDENYLGQFQGDMLGNFRTLEGNEIVGIFLRIYSRLDMVWMESELEFPTSLGWRGSDLVHVSGGYFSWDFVISASAADLDGDGRKDIVALVGVDSLYSDLKFYRNIGGDSLDSFQSSAGMPLMQNRFPYNGDTIFSSPQIGDITGDGRTELALIVQSSGLSQIQFYAVSGEVNDSAFVFRPEWSNGLPLGASNIRLVDLDGDGICELVLTSGTDWRVFFLRNENWTEIPGILPITAAQNVSFADANGDGNPDLFTTDAVWLNLTPSGMKHDSNLPPSSFALSAYPNPFNPTTEITFSLPKAGYASVKVYDILGQQITTLQDGVLTAGEHHVTFDGNHFPTGIYFLRLEAASYQRTLKLVLLK